MINQIFNPEMTSAWIGVIGTIIATILSGVISAVIALHMYKNQIEKEKKEQKNIEKAYTESIDDLIDWSFGSLLMLVPNSIENGLKVETAKKELKILHEVISELKSTSLHFLPREIQSEFQSIRILLVILSIELEGLIENSPSNIIEAEKLVKIGLDSRTIKIVEHFMNITRNKELFEGVYKDLKNGQMKLQTAPKPANCCQQKSSSHTFPHAK